MKQDFQNLSDLQEKWASPPSLKCPYVQVSCFGRVKTLDHSVRVDGKCGRYERPKKGRPLKPSRDNRGRLIIGGGSFSKRLIGKSFFLSHLVAECFVPNEDGNPYVFFKDTNRGNVHSDNLKWGDQETKSLNAYGRHVKHILAVRNKKNVEIGKFRGIGEVARRIGLTKQAVHYAMLRDTPTRKGYSISQIAKSNT